MSKKMKAILGIIAIYIGLYIVARNNYVIEWLARRWFLFLWVPVIVGILINKHQFARTFLVGVLAAIPLSQVVDNIAMNFIEHENRFSTYVGVPLYIVLVLITAVISLWRQKRMDSSG